MASSSAEVQEGMWQHMTIDSGATMQRRPYAERSGEPDCTYYLRTGLCDFGMTCRFNHPPDRDLAIATAIMKGEYPERVGRPECQYYLKTGTCKFGPTCKFNHPREKARLAGMVQLNTLGYPLHPNENECAYYLKTGQCKYGDTCKFHHPEPINAMNSLCGSAMYPSVYSSARADPSYTGTVASWALPRAFFIASPTVLSPMGLPLRPGEEQCKFYSRYGFCKFGAICKFDHPMATTPMGVDAYGSFASASPATTSTDAPMVVRHLQGWSSGSGHTS